MNKVFVLEMQQEDDILIKDTSRGELLITPTKGGTFNGEKLRGKIIPIGTTEVYTPYAGINDIFTKLLLKTDDGCYIHMEMEAYFDADTEQEKSMIAGEYVDPDKYYFKGTVKFQAESSKYKWLERKVCVSDCVIINWHTMRFTIYIM